MALILVLQRVVTGHPGKPESEYAVQVLINHRVIGLGRVTGHRYDDGWRALVKKFLDEGGGTDLAD